MSSKPSRELVERLLEICSRNLPVVAARGEDLAVVYAQKLQAHTYLVLEAFQRLHAARVLRVQAADRHIIRIEKGVLFVPKLPPQRVTRVPKSASVQEQAPESLLPPALVTVVASELPAVQAVKSATSVSAKAEGLKPTNRPPSPIGQQRRTAPQLAEVRGVEAFQPVEFTEERREAMHLGREAFERATRGRDRSDPRITETERVTIRLALEAVAAADDPNQVLGVHFHFGLSPEVGETANWVNVKLKRVEFILHSSQYARKRFIAGLALLSEWGHPFHLPEAWAAEVRPYMGTNG